jgi:hypothetical protein
MTVKASFSPDSPVPQRAALSTHVTTEWEIDLPASWKQVGPPSDNAVTFESEADRVGIFITVDFYEIPADKARATAERVINSRLARHKEQSPGQVDVFDSGTQAHAQGAGLEMHYAAHIANADVVLYVVYVMPRRVLNLTLVCKASRTEALALLNNVRAHFRPKLA